MKILNLIALTTLLTFISCSSSFHGQRHIAQSLSEAEKDACLVLKKEVGYQKDVESYVIENQVSLGIQKDRTYIVINTSSKLLAGLFKATIEEKILSVNGSLEPLISRGKLSLYEVKDYHEGMIEIFPQFTHHYAGPEEEQLIQIYLIDSTGEMRSFSKELLKGDKPLVKSQHFRAD